MIWWDSHLHVHVHVLPCWNSLLTSGLLKLSEILHNTKIVMSHYLQKGKSTCLRLLQTFVGLLFPNFLFFFNQIKVYYLKWYYDQKIISFLGEQGWCSGESARLPPMCPGFDSRTRRHMWVEFVVGSLLCSERFFSGYSGFPLSSKTNISKFQFDLECTDISEGVLVNSLVLRG